MPKKPQLGKEAKLVKICMCVGRKEKAAIKGCIIHKINERERWLIEIQISKKH